jgi:hypothetical protein
MPLVRHLALAALTIAAGPASSLAAQWPTGVTPGARVQARLPETQLQIEGPRGHLVRGRVTALTADTLYLAVTDSLGPLAIPRPLILRLDLSRGVPSRGESALRRGLGTAVAGALTGLLVAAFDDDVESGDGALVGAGIGLAVGAISGALFPRERWKRARSAL